MSFSPIVNHSLLTILKTNSLYFESPIHGIYHWRTVERNGHYLAQHTGADTKVVSYFAHFHDCMRENEDIDPKHGLRGANFAIGNIGSLDLTGPQLEKLVTACKGHTYGQKASCPTVATCWDADRLDIGRVGIVPNAKYLFSDEAKRIADQDDYWVLELFGGVKVYDFEASEDNRGTSL